MITYDFHIHSALSPCGDNEMTPNNIVNMAAVLGLSCIAVSDHNTVGNARAAMLAGEKVGVSVLPGMEVETEEEVHILTVYPKGHGKGAVLNKLSKDGGISWSSSVENTPVSWESSLETPTVYRLEFSDGTPDRLILISANAKWPGMKSPGGFECSLSDDEGKTWTEFQRFFGYESENPVSPIVAMASLTRLKENGKFVDRWMGFFHDSAFHNYKTILSFDENGKMQWSVPEKYLSLPRDTEKRAQMFEI